MWYSVVDPRSPGYKNKVVASFADYADAQHYAAELEGEHCDSWPFFVISTPTKPSIGEVVDPNDLTEDERW
jgi:hypothetical protein